MKVRVRGLVKGRVYRSCSGLVWAINFADSKHAPGESLFRGFHATVAPYFLIVCRPFLSTQGGAIVRRQGKENLLLEVKMNVETPDLGSWLKSLTIGRNLSRSNSIFYA